MPYKVFPGKLDATGAGTVEIQQENALKEWDIYQLSVAGSSPATNNMTCQVLLNGFLLCNSPAAAADTATGPPDAIIQRNDDLKVVFINGIPNDSVSVGIWYSENTAGTSSP